MQSLRSLCFVATLWSGAAAAQPALPPHLEGMPKQAVVNLCAASTNAHALETLDAYRHLVVIGSSKPGDLSNHIEDFVLARYWWGQSTLETPEGMAAMEALYAKLSNAPKAQSDALRLYCGSGGTAGFKALPREAAAEIARQARSDVSENWNK